MCIRDSSRPALYEAYTTLPDFREYLIDDILERTYQDMVTDRRTSVEPVSYTPLVNGSYIDAHIYEVAERSKRGKPTAFRVVADAPVENPFEPVGGEIAITQSGGIPCGLVYKQEMEGFILSDKTVLRCV